MATASTSSRAPGRTLYGYLIREMMFPTLFTLSGLTLMALTKELLKLSDLLINRGLGAPLAASIALYKAIPIASDMLPLAVLVGMLVALGRLSADFEVVALEACGVSARRLHGPVLSSAAVMTLIGVGLGAVATPWAHRSLDVAMEEITREHPGATLRAGVLHRFGQWRLQAREVSASGDQLRGVVLWTPEIGETLFAEHGALSADPTGQTRITMENATVLVTDDNELRHFQFDTMTSLLPESGHRLQYAGPGTLAAATFGELFAIEGTDEIVRPARVELHRRFARPMASLFFGLLVMPIFLARGASSRASGGLLGLLATLLYYGLVQAANGLLKGDGSVAVAVWLPNAILGTVGALAFLWLGRASVFAWRMERGPQRERRRFSWRRTRERRADSLRQISNTSESPDTPRVERRRVRTHRWSLQRYIATLFLRMLLLSFGVLLVGYLVIDILERLQWFANFNATASEAVRFYGFRIPLLVSRLVPMALLVATALTVSLVAVQGELTGMRGCGISAPRGMLPVLIICTLIAPLSFVLNNEIVPRANILNEYLKETEIKADEVWRPFRTDGERHAPAVWFMEGRRLLEAERLDPQLGTAVGLTVSYSPEHGFFSRRERTGGREQRVALRAVGEPGLPQGAPAGRGGAGPNGRLRAPRRLFRATGPRHVHSGLARTAPGSPNSTRS